MSTFAEILDTPVTQEERDFLDRADKLANRIVSGELTDSDIPNLSDEDREAFEFLCFAAFVTSLLS